MLGAYKKTGFKKPLTPSEIVQLTIDNQELKVVHKNFQEWTKSVPVYKHNPGKHTTSNFEACYLGLLKHKNPRYADLIEEHRDAILEGKTPIKGLSAVEATTAGLIFEVCLLDALVCFESVTGNTIDPSYITAHVILCGLVDSGGQGDMVVDQMIDRSPIYIISGKTSNRERFSETWAIANFAEASGLENVVTIHFFYKEKWGNSLETTKRQAARKQKHSPKNLHAVCSVVDEDKTREIFECIANHKLISKKADV